MDIVWQAEDSLQEKKVESDLKDLLKTLVAFANSVAPGDTAKIFIGERNDGTVQGVSSWENIQNRVKKEAEKIYPEIYYKTEVYEREAKQCVRVDIKHNGLAPHFGGHAWVRRAAQTIDATEELYQQMIDLRQSKVHALIKWLNRKITVQKEEAFHSGRNTLATFMVQGGWSAGLYQATLLVVNAHWVTFGLHMSHPEGSCVEKSEPMEKLLISWDDEQGS